MARGFCVHKNWVADVFRFVKFLEMGQFLRANGHAERSGFLIKSVEMRLFRKFVKKY